MEEQISLEIRGERAANYIRAVLIVLFTIGTVLAIATGSITPVMQFFYVLGVVLYSLSFVISIIVLRLNIYRPWMKYANLAFEAIGYLLVNYSYILSDDPVDWTISVKNHTRFGIYFLLMGTAMLRFSPRYTMIAGTAFASVFALLHLLLLQKGIQPLISNAQFNTKGFGLLDFLVGALFIFMMGIILAIATRFVREIILRVQKSEAEARKSLETIRVLSSGARAGAEELTHTVESLGQVTATQEEYSREQMGAIQETTASMEQISTSMKHIQERTAVQDDQVQKNRGIILEMASTVQEIEKAIGEATRSSTNTLDLGKRGEEELQDVVEGIRRIQQGSERVAAIVSVINDISSRTNLLALNAAIEAARAGEEGRGFSVVADEVSKLADLSSHNASEIVKLIAETNSDTESGVESIERAANTLREIISGIRVLAGQTEGIQEKIQHHSGIARTVEKGTGIVRGYAGEIRDAAIEQLKGVEGILEAVNSLNQGAENYHLTAQTIREATVSLKEITARLQEGLQGLDREGNEARKSASVG